MKFDFKIVIQCPKCNCPHFSKTDPGNENSDRRCTSCGTITSLTELRRIGRSRAVDKIKKLI
ncbi:hypothetical protein HG66A1_42660 [Gimesia chilikensis]|uniref:Uncharacterized protein n=1 Tax=Gimesia chilikensis TaxID=2605989 RepID=A0A517PSW4_9PLAN|nr:hypothetical protein HG66A1_42660 [Gimesia chilikensis]